MRFKTGSKVEVLNTRESTNGSWWLAEIMSGNGHYYNVLYDICPPHMGSDIVERVPRKAIRPCPPSVRCPKSWVTGDAVEVFHRGSWKQSMVEKVVGRNYYFVRLLGSSEAFKAHSSNLRLRQCWKDPKWMVVGKDSRSSDDGRLSKTRNKWKISCQVVDQSKFVANCLPYGHTPSVNSANILKPHMISPRGVKRVSIDNNMKRHRLSAGHLSRLPEKVDAVASPPKRLGEISVHIPYNRDGYYEIYQEGEKPNDDIGCLYTRTLEPNNHENDHCSFCSSTGSNSHYHSLAGPSLDLDNFMDDACSIDMSKYEDRNSTPQVDVALEIHKVELHAYRSTMGALYASGPISWEQEVLLTNLRLELNISNDEHLMEIKHLTSLSQ